MTDFAHFPRPGENYPYTNINEDWSGLAFAKFSMTQMLTNVQQITGQSTPTAEHLPIKGLI